MNNGKATGEYEDFLTGFVTTDGQVWGRPVGVAVGRDGALYVKMTALAAFGVCLTPANSETMLSSEQTTILHGDDRHDF